MFSIGVRPVSYEDPVSEESYQDERTEVLRKRLCHYRKGPEKEFPENLRRPTLSTIRMEYMNFDGTVTMLLRVVAPETPEMIDEF